MHLGPLKRLRSLRLHGVNYAPDFFSEIVHLTGLEELVVERGVGLDEESLRQIAQLTSLERLAICQKPQRSWDEILIRGQAKMLKHLCMDWKEFLPSPMEEKRLYEAFPCLRSFQQNIQGFPSLDSDLCRSVYSLRPTHPL